MALYFCAMYLIGGAFGPQVLGLLSDYCTRSAAVAAGVPIETYSPDQLFDVLKPYMPEGIHQAMFVLPVVNLLLAVVLFAGSRTVKRDAERLQKWMRETTADDLRKPEKVGV